jgi:hypothetical protein
MKQNYFLNTFTAVMLLVLVLSTSAVAQYSFTAASTPVTENFDNIGTPGVQGLTPAANITPDENFAVPNLPNWTIWRKNRTDTGSDSRLWQGTDAGAGGSGGGRSAGASGSLDRALGTLGSGGTAPAFGTRFVNNIIPASRVNSISISFTAEQWRDGSNATVNEVTLFEYSTDATSILTGTWTPFPSLNVLELNTTSTAGAARATALASSISGTITGLDIAVGGSFWIRWSDPDDFGTDMMMAVDDLSVTVTATTSNESDIAASGVADVSGLQPRSRRKSEHLAGGPHRCDPPGAAERASPRGWQLQSHCRYRRSPRPVLRGRRNQPWPQADQARSGRVNGS